MAGTKNNSGRKRVADKKIQIDVYLKSSLINNVGKTKDAARNKRIFKHKLTTFIEQNENLLIDFQEDKD